MQETTAKPTNGATRKIPQELEALFNAGAHIGHSKVRRHPKMGKYVFGTRNNVEIFDLQSTADQLKNAEAFIKELGRHKKLVLLVGSKPAARKYVEEAAQKMGMPYVTERWLGGILTNFKAIESRLLYWQNLEKEVAEGRLEKYVKKERVLKLVELRKLNRMFGGLRAFTAIPQAMIIVDSGEEHTATLEAIKKNVPIVALVNNDCNPNSIAYPIPVNDDSTKAISLVLNRLADAYEEGKREGVPQTNVA